MKRMKLFKGIFIIFLGIFGILNFGRSEPLSDPLPELPEFERYNEKDWEFRGYPSWMMNEMQRREIKYSVSNPNYWEMMIGTYEESPPNKTTNFLYNVSEDGQHATGGIYRIDIFYHPILKMFVTNGISSIYNWKTEDMKWYCFSTKYEYDPSDYRNFFDFHICPIISNNIIRINGDRHIKYNLYGVDPTGKMKTAFYIIDKFARWYANESDYYVTCDSIDPDSFVGKCNASVRKYLKNMYTDGIDHVVNWYGTYHYQNWWVRRLPCLPIECSSGPKGNCSMQVISPHFYISAKHWNRWVGGTQKYVSDDLSITNIVKLDGKMVSLKQWAIDHTNEYGFTKSDIYYADDIVVGQYTNGAVDESMCPYFMTYETRQKCIPIKGNHSPEYDKSKLAFEINVLGWAATQAMQGWVLPNEFCTEIDFCYNRIDEMNHGFDASFKFDKPDFRYDGIFNAIYYPHRKDIDIRFGMDRETYDVIKSVMPEDGDFKFAPVWAGDSGLPSYLECGDKIIILGQYQDQYGGSAYWSVFKVLKAYIESKGDTLKEFTWPN